MPKVIYSCSIERCTEKSTNLEDIQKHEVQHKKWLKKEKTFEVGYYDSFDREWCEISRHATIEEAKEVCDEKQNGLSLGNMEFGEYYAVWQKLWSGRYVMVHRGQHDREKLLEKEIEQKTKELERLKKQKSCP